MGEEHDLKEDDLQRMGISGLIGFGIMMGLVHVLTGLDHMSAIAQLSCGSRLQGFFLGCRWGLGHSVGLCIMYVVSHAVHIQHKFLLSYLQKNLKSRAHALSLCLSFSLSLSHEPFHQSTF